MARQATLSGKEQLELLVKRTIWEVWVRRNRDMNCHRLVLANPIGPIVALVFDRRVPPTAQVDDMVRGGDV